MTDDGQNEVVGYARSSPTGAKLPAVRREGAIAIGATAAGALALGAQGPRGRFGNRAADDQGTDNRSSRVRYMDLSRRRNARNRVPWMRPADYQHMLDGPRTVGWQG
jgi:hypothetical protein